MYSLYMRAAGVSVVMVTPILHPTFTQLHTSPAPLHPPDSGTRAREVRFHTSTHTLGNTLLRMWLLIPLQI